HRTGVLWLAREDDPHSLATRDTLARVGAPMEIVPPAELAGRYPQMQTRPGPSGGVFGILEPESGVLMARRAVAAVVDDAVRHGVVYATEAIGAPFRRGAQVVARTAAGEELSAGTWVFACGPWLPILFPGLLGKRIRPTRQEVFFFAPPAGDR